MCSVAPPAVRLGHGERQRHRGERGDLPVQRARQEELVEDHHGDGLAEDHTDGHHLQRGRVRQHGEFSGQYVKYHHHNILQVTFKWS